MIFGGWNPVRAAFGAYLFGVLAWAALQLQPRLAERAVPSRCCHSRS